MNKINQHLNKIKAINFLPLIEIGKQIPNFQLEPLLMLFFTFLAKNSLIKNEFKVFTIEKGFTVHTLKNEAIIKTHLETLIMNPLIYAALLENESVNSVVASQMTTKVRFFEENYQIKLSQKGIIFFLDAFYAYNQKEEVKKCLNWMNNQLSALKEKDKLERKISPLIKLHLIKKTNKI